MYQRDREPFMQRNIFWQETAGPLRDARVNETVSSSIKECPLPRALIANVAGCLSYQQGLLWMILSKLRDGS